MGNILSDLLDSLRTEKQKQRIAIMKEMKEKREQYLNTRKPGEENLPLWVVRAHRQKELEFRDDIIGN